MERYIDKMEIEGKSYNIEGSTRVEDTDMEPFYITDDKGNVLAEFENGGFKTKNFESDSISNTSSSTSADLEIKDSNGNVLAKFAYGNFETKYHKNYVLNILFERGGIDEYGICTSTIASFETCRTAFFINTNEAKEMFSSIDGYMYKYDENHNLIEISTLSKGNPASLVGCSFIKLKGVPIGPSKEDFTIPFSFNGEQQPFEEKNVAMRTPSERLIYHVDGDMFTTALLMLPPNYTVNGKKVPLIVWDSGDGSFSNWNSYEMGTGYEARRKGLEYMRDQGFAVLEIYSWGSYYYKQYPGCGQRSAMPIPTHIKTHEKGVEYVCSRYNVDYNNVFHLSKSGSGKMALGYALDTPKFGLKSIYAMAPVFDDLNFNRWGMPDYRKALFEELNMDGTEEQIEQFRNGYSGDATHGWLLTRGPYNGTITPEELSHLHKINQDFVKKNISKFSVISVNWKNLIGQSPEEKFQDTLDWGYKFWETDKPNWANHESPDEQGKFPTYNTNTDIYNKHNLTIISNSIPITVIMSKDDEQTPYWSALEVINQLRNGGKDATIVPLPSQGHSAPDMGSGVNSVSDVTTVLGIHYDSVSIGWHIACMDIFKKYLSHLDADVKKYVVDFVE